MNTATAIVDLLLKLVPVVTAAYAAVIHRRLKRVSARTKVIQTATASGRNNTVDGH